MFQEKDVRTIVEEVVQKHSYSDLLRFELSGARNYVKRDYCVQYRESDFAFISRLLESEGMYYYFEHSNGKHVMVVSDSPHYTELKEVSKFRFAPNTGADHWEDVIEHWQFEEAMHAGVFTTRDFHHEKPTAPLENSEPSPGVAEAGKKLEVYDYPGEDAKKFNKSGSFDGVNPEAEAIIRLRMQTHESFRKVVSGGSRGCTLASGYKMTVDDGGTTDSYLLFEVKHHAEQTPDYQEGNERDVPYRNSFKAIPADVAYVPPAVTGRSLIYGLQTARVIDESPSGNTEEIWPDQYGRVRVRFHWDREYKYACWLRVVQPWAGRSWGQQWIPRVGDEVAVTFLEGDPDCPVIIGGVFNADNMPIFTLPDNKTQSGILTRSTKSGGTSNFNMLRFEDKMGSEEVHLQAEKDLNSLIKNDETRTVKANRTSTIHVNDSRTVETGQDAVTVQQGNRTVTVHQKITTVSETSDINTTANQHITTIAQNGHITVEACSGHVSVSSPQSITLTCGGSTITMTPGSISIKSGMVYINS